MKLRQKSDAGVVFGLLGLWAIGSLAVCGVLGLFPERFGHSLGVSLAFLALTLWALVLVTEQCVLRVAVPEVSTGTRWGVLAIGCGVTVVSWLAVRFGLPLRGLWEGTITCGQILIVGVGAGSLSRLVKHPAELWPLVSVMVCADAVSFLAGPTHFIANDVAAYYLAGREGLYPISEMLLMKFPIPGSFDLYPLFGMADWFMVIFLGGASRFFHIDDRVMGIPLAVLGLFLASASARIFQVFIPALPVLAIFYLTGMVLRHRSVFRPGRREVLLFLFPLVASLALFLLMGEP
ncbi:hypothetical protein [Desulfoluna sp.]|uniref:hypothetical protein n=1 Tax=Desulfoluna sp. TaxID=2045199 RepID=UPI00261EFB06|nr:hypothetical protein [Desulfoluna sp.]